MRKACSNRKTIFRTLVNRKPTLDHEPGNRPNFGRGSGARSARVAYSHRGEDLMRNLMAGVLALSAIGVVGLASSSPAMAYDYPWCVQGRGVGFPGDCSYDTIEQCRASSSGRNLACNINPRVAFRRASRGYAPYPGAYYR